jgi:hypothetical protein
MQKKLTNTKTSLFLILLLAVTSCGYHFSGTGAVVPEGVKTIAIPVFFNTTNEPSIDIDVTQAVVEEFMTDGRLKVVGLEDADLALHGTIVKYEATPLAYTVFQGQTFVQQYRVHMVVEAYLEDVRSKKVLWREIGVESNFISDYAVTMQDIRATRVSKDAAIKKAGQDIAWTLRSRVLEGF